MQKKFSLSFDSSWVLTKKDDDVLPIEAFIKNIKELFDVEVLSSSLTDCDILIKDGTLDDNIICEKISALLKEKFSLLVPSDSVEYALTEYVFEPTKEDEAIATPSVNDEDISEDNTDNKVEDVLNRINALIGAEEFKKMADECVRIAPGLIKHNTVEAFTHQCYILAINDGNGLSTYLKLFAELLTELGLFKFNEKSPVAEEKLLPPQIKESGNNPFSSVLSHFQRFNSGAGQIISIDISEWMTKISDKNFRDFLSVLDDHMGENIIVFRVPFVEKEVLNGLKRGIGDVLFVRDISFVPFDHFELTKCAEESLAKLRFTMEDEAWDVFHARITEEKNDGRFYGINTVNKVIREMIYRKQLDNALNDIDDTVIKKSEILGLAATYTEQNKTGLDMLDDFIGMETIKSKVEEIIAQIEMSTQNNKLGHPCIHMRFVGNPGTGKTTVARVIGKILKQKGILRNGNFFEYSGRDFCGRYVGETAPKTAAMCRDAYGSVLFIDEAYALYRGDGYSTVDYGREAIDTLIAEMENHRQDLVVIMAGYTDEMNNLMKANVGLESRMPYIIEFPNYSREQLCDIFMLMVNQNFKYQDGFVETVREYFNALPDEVILSKEFSNARFVRNLFERTWGKSVMRNQFNKSDTNELTKEDFALASSEKEFNKIMQKQNRTLGFI